MKVEHYSIFSYDIITYGIFLSSLWDFLPSDIFTSGMHSMAFFSSDIFTCTLTRTSKIYWCFKNKKGEEGRGEKKDTD